VRDRTGKISLLCLQLPLGNETSRGRLDLLRFQRGAGGQTDPKRQHGDGGRTAESMAVLFALSHWETRFLTSAAAMRPQDCTRKLFLQVEESGGHPTTARLREKGGRVIFVGWVSARRARNPPRFKPAKRKQIGHRHNRAIFFV